MKDTTIQKIIDKKIYMEYYEQYERIAKNNYEELGILKRKPLEKVS